MNGTASPNPGQGDIDGLLARARACTICSGRLPHPPRPVVQIGIAARIVLIGQAPSRRVHEGGRPWDDDAGGRLRNWLGLDEAVFYSPALAHMPMGLCYPGAARGGDAPPRPECAPHWHDVLLAAMPALRLRILIGRHALARYLPPARSRPLGRLLREPARLPGDIVVLPHPSRRNTPWLKKHAWFEADIVPQYRARVAAALR